MALGEQFEAAVTCGRSVISGVGGEGGKVGGVLSRGGVEAGGAMVAISSTVRGCRQPGGLAGACNEKGAPTSLRGLCLSSDHCITF